MTLHLVNDPPEATSAEVLVSDSHGTFIGWATAAGTHWIAYHQSVFGTVTCCGAHATLAAAADAVRDRQEVQG